MFKPGRRALVRKALFTLSTAAAAPFIDSENSFAQANRLLPSSDNTQRYSFFTSEELTFINAVLDRLIPSDELGAGAREAGVAWFLDQQLAGPYGRAARWYMEGPWRVGTPQQGYQSKFTPAQLYRAGIKALDDHCRKTHRNRTFAQLPVDLQESLMTSMDNGELQLPGAQMKEFFKIVQQNATEGFLADPMYGGNHGSTESIELMNQ